LKKPPVGFFASGAEFSDSENQAGAVVAENTDLAGFNTGCSGAVLNSALNLLF
jgi:hypothetical protein